MTVVQVSGALQAVASLLAIAILAREGVRSRSRGATLLLLGMVVGTLTAILRGFLTKGVSLPVPARPLVDLSYVGLALFPWLLYEFSRTFGHESKRQDYVARTLTAALAVAALTVPGTARPGGHASTEPPGVRLYSLVLVLQFTTLLAVVALRLWRDGRSVHVSLIRQRMRLMAVGAAGVGIGLPVSALVPPPGVVIGRLITTTAVLALAFSFGPPRWLRARWRGRDVDHFRTAMTGLVAATSAQQVYDSMLPSAGGLVGADHVVLLDAAGRELASWSSEPARAALDRAARGGEADLRGGRRVIEHATSTTRLVVYASRYAPVFGKEEVEQLAAAAALIDLALDRAQRFENERDHAERLREIDRMKDTFIAAVSHDLRTPLTAVLGFAMTLESHTANLTPERTTELSAEIARGAQRMSRMLDALLDLSRITHGTLKLQLEDADASAVVREIVERLGVPRTSLQTAETPVLVRMDVAKVERIVENLLLNAERHTPPGTQIKVTVEAEGTDQGVVILVDDAGPGVPAELRDVLFEPFERGEGASRTGPGTGLGLAIVGRLAELHGGQAWISDSPLGGARFGVYLPATPTGPRASGSDLIPARYR
jgi:signal transduction histidine kinase